jgi:hypothetical protein
MSIATRQRSLLLEAMLEWGLPLALPGLREPLAAQPSATLGLQVPIHTARDFWQIR